ncbi:MAG: hypothetical protein ABR554_15985, partial [Pyrinomonadaceae bacterium]
MARPPRLVSVRVFGGAWRLSCSAALCPPRVESSCGADDSRAANESRASRAGCAAAAISSEASADVTASKPPCAAHSARGASAGVRATSSRSGHEP